MAFYRCSICDKTGHGDLSEYFDDRSFNEFFRDRQHPGEFLCAECFESVREARLDYFVDDEDEEYDLDEEYDE